jgi:hypothetical protein
MHYPPFAVSCLHEGLVIEEDKAWVEFEGVSTFQVLLTPLTQNFAAQLEVAIEQDCAVTTQDLLELGQDPNSTLACGSTAVVKCCECNATAVLRKLLEGKADPNRIGPDGRNPLHTAVSAQNYGAVKTLLLHGANANLQDAEGNAATHVVARAPDADMLGLLMGHGASLLLENHQGQCWFSLADLCQFTPFALDSAWQTITWGYVLRRLLKPIAAFGLYRQLGATCRRLHLEADCLLPVGRTQDVQGGAEPVLQKDPEVWLQICHNRATALTRRWEASLSKPKTEQELINAVMSVEQARYYLTSYKEAKAKQTWLRNWDVAMPPMIRQTFGVRNTERRGVRIPLPPLTRPVAILPAAYTVLEQSPQFDWLEICHPHQRDRRIRFMSDGHKYFVDDEPVDVSVTGLVGSYAEDCLVFFPNVMSGC